jgi:imidazolonepropionase-like amidohydrolase
MDPAASRLALVGATIHAGPGEDPIHGGVVLVEGATIAAVGTAEVPDGARVLDCSGLTVTAGFWNSHVHFFERKWADAATIPAREGRSCSAPTWARWIRTRATSLR